MGTETLRVYSDRDKFGLSSIYEVNFYFESGKLGVSDNHRMAYPFFIRQGGTEARLIHLDAHNDCSYFLPEAQEALAQIDATSDIDAFVRHRFYCQTNRSKECPVHYGNWITALFRTHPHMFAGAYIISNGHSLGETASELPTVKMAEEQTFWCAAGEHGSANTYYSIDIDYYFDEQNGFAFRQGHKDPYGHFRECLEHALADARSPVFVALSPEFCGGWHSTIPFLHIIDQVASTSLAGQVQEHFP